MVDLDELEAKARAHKEATERWAVSLVDVSLPGATTEQRTRHEANVAAFENAEEAYADAFGPDTILDLMERVRAGEELFRASDVGWTISAVHSERCVEGDDCSCDEESARLDAARERWESLAHSPQEAV